MFEDARATGDAIEKIGDRSRGLQGFDTCMQLQVIRQGKAARGKKLAQASVIRKASQQMRDQLTFSGGQPRIGGMFAQVAEEDFRVNCPSEMAMQIGVVWRCREPSE